MLAGIVCIILYLLLISPVHIRADAFVHTGVQLDCWARIWGLPFGWSMRMSGGQGPIGNINLRQIWTNASAVLRGSGARQYFRRHVRIQQLDACVRLCMQDAASTALMAGILQAAAKTLYSMSDGLVRVAVFPSFAAEKTELEARCIVSFRLGHMIIVGMAALAAWMLERREHGLTHSSKEV